MPGNYTDIVARTGNAQALMPEQYVADAIIQALPAASLVLSAGVRRIPLARGQARFPVVDVLPNAFFVGGETGSGPYPAGLKETSVAIWANRYINVEELAVIVPIPIPVLEDAAFDIFALTQPLIVQALGKAIDQAVLFGVGKPASWDMSGKATPIPGGIVQVATALNHRFTATGTGPTTPTGWQYTDIINTMKLPARDGFPVDAFVSSMLYEYSLLGVTDTLGRPLFIPSMDADGRDALLGRPFMYLSNGAWDDTLAQLVCGDFSNYLVIGMRRDMTFEIFREGVVTDDTGAVVLNLMQQNVRALRVSMRLGATVGVPALPMQKTPAQRLAAYPFGVLGPSAMMLSFSDEEAQASQQAVDESLKAEEQALKERQQQPSQQQPSTQPQQVPARRGTR